MSELPKALRKAINLALFELIPDGFALVELSTEPCEHGVYTVLVSMIGEEVVTYVYTTNLIERIEELAAAGRKAYVRTAYCSEYNVVAELRLYGCKLRLIINFKHVQAGQVLQPPIHRMEYYTGKLRDIETKKPVKKTAAPVDYASNRAALGLFFLVLLLGGKATLKEMAELPTDKQQKGLTYLRDLYNQKYLDGKTEAGKQPEFIRKYLTKI